MAKTLFGKIWDQHIVTQIENGPNVLYIDRHLIHEVTSPQAFNEISNRGLNIFRPEKITATMDHNVPTENQHLPIKDVRSKEQIEALKTNCEKNNIELYGIGHPYQGIIHVIAPELGITQPGMTIVCGDSHTSTHGAFGCIAFGIGTSQVAQVFASQCLLMDRPQTMRITINGKLTPGIYAKDVILYIIAQLGTNAGTGYFIEFAGEVFENMSMESRMTVCNMSIEMGARGGIIAPDQKTFDYMEGRKFAPSEDEIEVKLKQWKTLFSDKTARFDKEYHFRSEDIKPMITYGTNPGMGIAIDEVIPTLNDDSFNRSLTYMGFKGGTSLINLPINHVFIGSCTNSRIEDFRVVASYLKGRQKAKNINALIVPGSQIVAKQIKDEGLDLIFNEAGFKLREPGCSACLAMNEDKIPRGEYCVSTSNRNFEGRQGPGAKTILASPYMAAVTAIHGRIIDYTKQ